MSQKSVRWGRGFRQHIRVLAKTDAHPARPPSGLVVPTSPRLRGPKSGARRARQKQQQELLPLHFASLGSCAQERALWIPGPLRRE